jgi:hypothetical protein
MTWTTPKTWADQELVTADLLNTHLRDNLEALKEPPSGNYECDETSEYTTTSTSFVDVDATNLVMTLATGGGNVMVHFHGNLQHSGSSGRIYLDVEVDGTRVAGDDGIVWGAGDAIFDLTFTRLITGLSAGDHIFKLQWKTSAATATLYAGAGTSNKDTHPQFWAREVS